MARIFIANVGVNSFYQRKYRIMSPIFTNGSFEFISIKERSNIIGNTIPTYSKIKCVNSIHKLSYYLPKKVKTYRVHDDPEFMTFTYGDSTKNSRSANLKYIRSGDYLFFLARLVTFENSNFYHKKGSFYLIGYLKVEDIFISEEDINENRLLLKNNAHFKRYELGYENIGEFIIIKGSEKESQRFKKAVPVNKKFCDEVLRTKEGKMFNWKKGTEIQRIGSYTRTIRTFIDEKELHSLWGKFWKIINSHINSNELQNM